MKLSGVRRRGSAIAVAFVGAAILAAAAAPVASQPLAHTSCSRFADDPLAVQFLAFSDALDKQTVTFEGRTWRVRGLSGLVYNQATKLYESVADQGNDDSHFLSLRLRVGPDSFKAAEVSRVTTLKSDAGVAFNGAVFDGEAIAVTREGNVFVASEGGQNQLVPGPSIRLFASDGTLLEELEVPERFRISPAGQASFNHTFESLALSPDGRDLFTANETPLRDDGQDVRARGRIRILRYRSDGVSGFVPAEQYYYRTEPGRSDDDVGVTELAALSSTELLVLERGFVAGRGNTVRIFLVSLADAADVRNEPALAGLKPLKKTLLVDLKRCPPSGATIPSGAVQPNPLLDNFEGMALGPMLSGRRVLVLQSDDNGNASQVTRLIAVLLPPR